jgi:hypothetical protein
LIYIGEDSNDSCWKKCWRITASVDCEWWWPYWKFWCCHVWLPLTQRDRTCENWHRTQIHGHVHQDNIDPTCSLPKSRLQDGLQALRTPILGRIGWTPTMS